MDGVCGFVDFSTVLLLNFLAQRDAPEVPMAERPPPNREAAGSIPARRAIEVVAEWKGAGLQSPMENSSKRWFDSSLPLYLRVRNPTLHVGRCSRLVTAPN